MVVDCSKRLNRPRTEQQITVRWLLHMWDLKIACHCLLHKLPLVACAICNAVMAGILPLPYWGDDLS